MKPILFALKIGIPLLLFPVFAQAQTNGFTVPNQHPRLWWNAERLQKTKTYFTSHPFTPDTDLPYDLALSYVLTGNTTHARQAITFLLDFIQQPPGQDPMRWEGEIVNLIYDWCHDQMTPAERNLFIERWSQYVENSNNLDWGSVGMEENNYYQGYLRNSLEWGIASFNENPKAQYFLDHALITRWENSYIPWAKTKGLGGVPLEGTQYGRYQMNYLFLPISTVGMLGRNMLRENPFYSEALFSIIYSTSHVPMYTKDISEQPYHQLYQFSDDQFTPFTRAADVYYGNILTMVATEWKDVPLGKYARNWLNKVNCPRDYIVEALDETTPSMDFSSLPLDYYAPGFKGFYLNSSWAPSATSALLQLGYMGGDHNHLDWGTFQIRRGSRWLTRETSDYDFNLKVGFGGNGLSQCRKTLHHNGIVFTGRGWTKGVASAYQLGETKVVRLESQPDYSYAAVDLSLAYQAEVSDYVEELPRTQERVPRDDNPFAKTVVREFIFLRNLETLVVFDRLESKDDTYYGNLIPTNPYGTATFPAEDVIKTFLLHSQTQPVLGGNSVLIRNGDQELKMTTLVPAAPSYNVVDDGNSSDPEVDRDPSWYQYRVEASTTGSAQSYFLNVLQARDANGTELAIDFTESATTYNITLTHPTLGKAAIVLEKGMTSSGGLIGYSPNAEPTLVALTNTVADIAVTDNGPVWGVQPVVAPVNVTTITATQNIASEPATQGQFTIQVNPSPSTPVTIKLLVTTGANAATPGTDYNALPTTVTVGTSGTATVNLIPKDDLLAESNETVTVTLQPDAAYTLGIATSAMVTINDNDEPNTVPNITTTALPDASTAENYFQGLTASSGNGTLKWAVVSGALPPGIELLNSGVLNGTPTTEGAYTFTVNVADSDANVNTNDEDRQEFTIVVTAPNTAPTITNTTLVSGTVGVGYTQTLNATGGNRALAWSIASGTLPPGLTLSATGVISGTPTTAIVSTFSVKVTDSDGDMSITDEDVVEFIIQVSPTIIPLTGIAFEPTTISMKVDETRQLNVVAIPKEAQLPILTFSTIENSIVSIDPLTGIVTAIAPGTATITATTNVGQFVATIVILVSNIETDDLPKYVSPNNDGIHDVWEWRNINKYIDCELTIFSRSGQEVFYAKPYENNWDATYKGKPLAQGDYYYILKYSDGKIKKGALRIIR